MNEYEYDEYEWLHHCHTDKDGMRIGCLGAAIYVLGLLLLLFCLLLGSCRSTRIIEYETVRHDTCFIDKWQRDSIHIRDSIYLHEWQQGETVYVQKDRWHTAWREKVVHDSIYIARRDTTIITETREVAKPLTWWQRTKMNMGLVLLGLLGIVGAIGIYKVYKIIRP